MRVFLHAGLPKTGSTTIQSSLFHSQALFGPQSILMPVYRPKALGHRILTDIRLADADRKEFARVSQADCAEVERRFVRDLDLAASGNLDVLISSESFSNERSLTSGLEIRKMIEERGARLSVLAYVRPPLNHLPSSISQEVKADPGSQKIEDRLFNHVSRAKLLWRVFGDDAVELRIFDRRVLTGGDVVTDFVAWLKRKGAPMPDIAAVDDRNEALSAAGCALLWSLRDKLKEDEGARDFRAIRKLALAHDLERSRPKLSLPEDWVAPLTALVAEAWHDLLARTANPEAERELYRLAVPPPGGATPDFSHEELFGPHMNRTYVSSVVEFGLAKEKGPLRRAARILKRDLGS